MKISVVVPCYNAERHLEQTLRSALSQTEPPSEIVVVDDGSTDASRTIAASFGPPVRLVEGPHAGAPTARNRGAEEATGDALMFLDADDLLGADALQALRQGLETEPEGVALIPWKRLIWREGGWTEAPASCPPLALGQDLLAAWLSGWYHPPVSVLWSRAAWERAGGWDASIQGNPNDDGELMMRALVRGVDFVRLDRGSAYYRRPREDRETLSGQRFSERGLRTRLEVLRKLIRLLQESPGGIDRYRQDLGHALDTLARDADGVAPDLARECRASASRWAGPPSRRALHRVLLRGRRHLRRVLDRTSAGRRHARGQSG